MTFMSPLLNLNVPFSIPLCYKRSNFARMYFLGQNNHILRYSFYKNTGHTSQELGMAEFIPPHASDPTTTITIACTSDT